MNRENEAPIAQHNMFEGRELENRISNFKLVGSLAVLTAGIVGACYLTDKLFYKKMASYEDEAKSIRYEAAHGSMDNAVRAESFLRDAVRMDIRSGELNPEIRSKLNTILQDIDYNGVAPDKIIPIVRTR